MRSICVMLFGTLAVLLTASCDERITEVNQLAALTANPTSAPADDVSLVILTATIDTSVDPTATTVTFFTSAGSFLPSGTSITVPVDSLRHATAYLRAPLDSVDALVSATSGGATQTRTVSFTPVPPTRLEVSSDLVDLTANQTATLTVTLQRPPGFATSGATVTFASSGAGGHFSPQTVLSKWGVAVTRFSPGSDSLGPVLIVTVASRGQQRLTDTTILQVVLK
jgi:hypothetical protein